MRDFNQQPGRESLVLRIVWGLGFLLAWQIAEILLAIVVVVQLCYCIFQGSANPTLLGFGDSLSQYLAQIGRFGSFNSEEKPWPFADWPTPQAATVRDEATRAPGP